VVDSEKIEEVEGGGVSGKEPWFAVVLSLFVWGAGQLYAGCIRKGCILILSMIGVISVSTFLFFGPEDNILLIIASILLFYVVHIWNLFDSYFSVSKRNPKEFERIRKSGKDAWLAVFLSFFFAGLGHLYIKKYLQGIVFILLSIVISYYTDKYLHIGKIGSAFFAGTVCLLAYLSSPVKREKTRKQITLITGLIIMVGLLEYSTAMICIKYVVQAYTVPTISMAPAVVKKDRILAKKSFYHIERGDVIVFKHPDDKRIPCLKRVIAFGGESVEIINGSVHINGKKIECPSCPEIQYSSMGEYGSEGNVYTVPERSYYALGDNSENSSDSRAFGAIPQEDVIGKAYKIYWPLSRFGLIE